MIRYLTLEEVLEFHRLMLEQSGGLAGVRDLEPRSQTPFGNALRETPFRVSMASPFRIVRETAR